MDLDFLKLKRQEANKTQAEVAGALKIGPQAYAKIESGENNLHPKHWKTIKSLLNVTQNELTDFTAAVAVARRQKKLEENTEAFAADWKLDAEGLDAVNQAVLRALKELPLVDRCRLLAFADDLKAARAAKPAPEPAKEPAPKPAPKPTPAEAVPAPANDAKTEAPAAEKNKKSGPEIRCPHCHEWLYGSYIPGEKFSCPECGQHIVIHHIAKQEE